MGLRAAGNCLRHPALHPERLFFRDHGADVSGRGHGVAHHLGLCGLGQASHKLLVYGPLYIDPLQMDADLSRIAEGGIGAACHGRCKVVILTDDGGRVGAQLHGALTQTDGRLDALAHIHAAGEAIKGDLLVGRQQRADGRAAAGEAADIALGRSGIHQQAADFQTDDGGDLRRLQQHRVARR